MKNWSGWLVLVLGVLIGLASGAAVYMISRQPSGQPIELIPKPTPSLMLIHVAGAVQNPGVYQLELGSRVQQAVDRAGGLLENANSDNINLAGFLQDGQRIYISLIGETTKSEILIDPGSQGKLIDLNTADIAELITLPGIGDDRAAAIIAYRNQIGGFKSIEQIQDIEGIGTATFEKLKSMITASPRANASKYVRD
jgi:competence protein ComEA